MSMNVDLERVRAHFKKDLFAAANGITIDSASEEGVVCGMEIRHEHRNSGGGVHGGAIFTLADLAFAVHCNLDLACGADVGLTVGQSCSISFLKGTRGSRLTAKSTLLSKGRSVSVYRVRVEDDLGVAVAEMLANGFRMGA